MIVKGLKCEERWCSFSNLVEESDHIFFFIRFPVGIFVFSFFLVPRVELIIRMGTAWIDTRLSPRRSYTTVSEFSHLPQPHPKGSYFP